MTAGEPAPNTFSFDTAGVQSLPAGSVEVTFTNVGTVPHEARLIKVRDDNFDEYNSAVTAQGEAGSAPLGDDVFDTGSIAPGKSTTATVVLAPGTYALGASTLSAPDGKTFAQHGMLTKVEVTPVATTSTSSTTESSASATASSSSPTVSSSSTPN